MEEHVISVSELNEYVKMLIENDEILAHVCVRGEISNFTNHRTGHFYLTLKDEGSLISIRAEIFCEKASHKGIIVGKNGEELKRVGSYARADLEVIFGTKVYLNLWVKVKENWRDSQRGITDFGYTEE